MSHPSIGLARQMAESGKLQEAMALLKKAFQENPNDAEIRQALMDIQERMMLEMQVAERIKKASALVEQGQKEAALQIIAEVLKIVPGHAGAMALKAKLAPSSPFEAPDSSGPNEFDFGSDGSIESPLEGIQQTEKPASSEHESLEMPALQPFDFGDVPEAAPAPLEQPSVVEATSFAAPRSSSGTVQLSSTEQDKVKQYLAEGKSLYSQGRAQDAIDVWTRVFILDEENGEAQELIDKARASLNANEGELEFTLNEAIAAFNAGEFGRAKPLLEKILQLSPGHREAQYYLSKIPAAAPEASPAPAASSQGFELESGPGAPPEPVQQEEGGFEGFELETDLTSETPLPPPPKTPTPAAPAAPVQKAQQPFPAGPLSEEFKFDEPAAKPAPPPAIQAPAAPASAGVAVRAAAAKKKGPSLGLILGGAAALLLIGAALIIIPKLLGGDEHPVATPAQTPVKAPVQAPPPPQQPVAPVEPVMSEEELLKAAGAAAAAKDFDKAIGYYKQVLSMDSVNAAALSGIDSARTALQQQQEDQIKNAKFLKDYQSSVKSFRDADYAESLRLAWRLIYPDDTLAKQLGKANSVRELLRNGYFNWAVRDLKSENPRGAEKNLRDLMDADKNDPEARKLLDFTRQYLNKPVDQKYRDAVGAMTYRSFTEVP